ncbi:Xanthine dehydrogenase [Gracilariopsis chorda]|uniref:Xanthine dehydrogenase n=1 Tax=Gracilariopsis chorda TaxID=448386 RepID=A0A2V3J0I2_9FLOR|nr:Xanthine dehydrogenase [Gracilariopsis chorda]|eukprot:PXF47901.1 Xanthine dehydrogenase [Gracilariopsis chorda]
MIPRQFVVVYINGSRREISGRKTLDTLLSYLRYEERLTGTKLGCGEGGCGACTILYSYYDHHEKRIYHRAVNACLMPVAACDGAAITTIEAVGNIRDGLAPVQEALANTHGSQCGFCTPGIVMSMFALLREHGTRTDPLTPLDVEKNFDGNLCRCTGYRPILDAYKGLIAAEDATCSAQCPMGEQCCKINRSRLGKQEIVLSQKEDKKISTVLDRAYIFPPELIEYRPAELNLADGKWLRPVTLEQLMRSKTEHPEARLIVGNTEVGVEVKFKNLKVPVWISTTDVPELQRITEDDVGVKIGASVTWTHLNNYISNALKRTKLDGNPKLYQLSSLQAIQSQLELFAGKQIRNVGTIAGNIVTASPISDVNPLLVAACASFTLLNCKTGEKRNVSARDFFVSYRKVDLKANEILFQVVLPWNESQFDFTHPFKVSRRREDDIAIVSAGIRLKLSPNQEPTSSEKPGFIIEAAHVGLGGIAPRTVSMNDVERVLTGKLFNETSLKEGMRVMARSALLPKNVPGGMPEYRQSLAVGFLFKAFVATAHAIYERFHEHDSLLDSLGFDNVQDVPGISICERSVSRGVQIFSDCEPLAKDDITGRPVPHLSAALQVSGEAKYLDDIPRFDGELQAALVLSSEPHARIVAIDYSDAEKIPGVYEIIDVKNVKGSNLIGPIFHDEYCFADKEVTTSGQVIAVVTAETTEQAKEAARSVRVTYDPLPAVVTIEDAIESASYAELVPSRFIQKGDAPGIFEKEGTGAKIVKGRVRIGGQEHWYLEPNGTIAVPDENGEMLILASTQSPGKTQAIVSRVLGQRAHKIVCKVKRLGGGFGGKETRSCFLSAAIAVAAQATSRPVRLVLDRDVDMMITGTRHAFLAEYEAAYEATGRITALRMEIYLNMGNTVDLSAAVLDRALYHAVNCYDIPNVDIIGKACYTNTTSSTAFRGFGGPQGMMICENVIEHVAWDLRLPPEKVRDINMFGRHGNASITPYGMNVSSDCLQKCWEGALGDSSFSQRRREVDSFNSKHSYRKRGLSVIPTMFGISFSFSPLNQAGALVHIYQEDGSVLITHGGVEMGQGLHTKICQIAASELQIPLEKVFVSETATDKIPNASPTAASASSDLYGMAVLRACRTLKQRLEPFKSGLELSWEETVDKAWANRVSLFATGFYKTPGIDDVNLAVPGARGRPFSYFTNGSAVSEVEIDVLTGEMKVIRTDIVMDIGRPLNPAIDIGQVEGAFVQGLGWCTMEEFVRGSKNEHVWLKEGKVFTAGPGTYKLPAFGDVPRDFRVRVLDGRSEADTICSSKAIGEPPLFLAASVFFATRDAISYSRRQHNLHDWFALDSPASVERIRLRCIDDVVSSVLPNTGSVNPSLSL